MQALLSSTALISVHEQSVTDEANPASAVEPAGQAVQVSPAAISP